MAELMPTDDQSSRGPGRTRLFRPLFVVVVGTLIGVFVALVLIYKDRRYFSEPHDTFSGVDASPIAAEQQLQRYRDAHPFAQLETSESPHLEHFFGVFRLDKVPGATGKRDDPLDHFYALEEDHQTEVIFACEVMLQYLEKIANQEIGTGSEHATRRDYVKEQYGRCELLQIYCRDQAQTRNLKLLKLVQ